MNIHELEPKIPHPNSVKFGEVKTTGCFPKNAYLTSNLVEMFYHDGRWQLPRQPRMDGLVRHEKDGLAVIEMNKLAVREAVVLGKSEDGSEGIYVTSLRKTREVKNGEFGFMSSDISREKRVDYGKLASVLTEAKKDNGKIVWVLGPAVIHAGGIENMEWLIRKGYVGAMLGGNAIAVHDIEHAMFGTSLGIKDDGSQAELGHKKHLEAINAVREVGSIQKAVESGLISRGIMYECVKKHVPYVLAGSIRDDGPLPDTITDIQKSQDAMREQTINASAVVMVATVLHSVATGNMTPTYRLVGEEIVPVPAICVDSTEFAVTKLSDRGTEQAYPVIGNLSDFLNLLVNELAKK